MFRLRTESQIILQAGFLLSFYVVIFSDCAIGEVYG